jgi:hypothetical protein
MALQIRAWADDEALQKVLVPIERALPEAMLQAKRASTGVSIVAALGSPLLASPLSQEPNLERRVASAVAACGACSARIKDLEAAFKA